MREIATTLLEFLGLLALAAGITGGLWQWLGAWALCVGGLLLLLGSAVASVAASTEGETP